MTVPVSCKSLAILLPSSLSVRGDRRIAFHTTEDYINLSDGVPAFVVEHALPAEGTANLMGLPFGGKSFLILQLAEAIANETRPDWIGFPVHDHGPVVVSQFDTPRRLWSNRVRGLRRELDFRRVWWSDRLDAPRPFDITRAAHADWFHDELHKLPEWPRAVIFDVMKELHRGDENSAEHMQLVIDGLVRAIEPAALMVVSHIKKPDSQRPLAESDPDMNVNRGSIYVNGRVDSVLKMTGSGLYMECRTAPKLHVPLTQQANGLWRPLSPPLDFHAEQAATPRRRKAAPIQEENQ